MEMKEYSDNEDSKDSKDSSEYGFIKTTIKFKVIEFERKNVEEIIRTLFKSIKCDFEGCENPARALIVEEKQFQCKEHQDLYTSDNKTVDQLQDMFLKCFRILEQDLVKLKCIMSFINTDHISKEINEENLQSLQNIYLEIIEQYKEVEVQTHNLSIDQSQTENSYEKVFNYQRVILELSNSIQNLNNEIRIKFGEELAKMIESSLFKSIIESNAHETEMRNHSSSNGDHLFTKEIDTLKDKKFEFCTLIAEPFDTLSNKLDQISTIIKSYDQIRLK